MEDRDASVRNDSRGCSKMVGRARDDEELLLSAEGQWMIRSEMHVCGEGLETAGDCVGMWFVMKDVGIGKGFEMAVDD